VQAGMGERGGSVSSVFFLTSERRCRSAGREKVRPHSAQVGVPKLLDA